MFNLNTIFTGLFLIFYVNNNLVIGQSFYYPQQYRAQSCITNYQSYGTCQYFSSCPSAISSFRIYGIRPTICSFHRSNPIVCCPTSRNSNYQQQGSSPRRRTQRPPPNGQRTNSGQRISEIKCIEEYSSSETTFHTTIVGGTKTSPGEYPYMAALGWPKSGGGYEYKCGGVLVSKQFVLSAAHCASLGGSAPSIVQTGGNPLAGGNHIVGISSVYVHPKYNIRKSYHDIALIKLLTFAVDKPACLWPSSSITSKQVTAIGYGHTQFAGASSPDLLKVRLSLFSNRQCQRYYPPDEKLPNGIVNSHICAGSSSGGKDTCQGDSGGPIIINSNIKNVAVPYVIGVTSFGQICGGSVPSVYTRISSYLKWIESIVWST